VQSPPADGHTILSGEYSKFRRHLKYIIKCAKENGNEPDAEALATGWRQYLNKKCYPVDEYGDLCSVAASTILGDNVS
jgi:hypothetical protein